MRCISSYYNRPAKMITPILTDVSLRDGIQGANPYDYPTNTKLHILRSICDNFSPQNIEIGSFVSPKVLPIMADTAKIFEQASNVSSNLYALVPNKVGLFNAIDSGFTNFSFITSVSNAFQFKNTGKNLLQKKTDLHDMMKYIAKLKSHTRTKLYVSCVNECPVTGPIDNDVIIYEILSSYGQSNEYSQYGEYDEICLSDTMGTLKPRDFEYIVDGLLRFGMPKTQLSVHLHINEENEQAAKRILFACFHRGISRFDVSVLSEGGCSVTMDKKQLKPNMTYEFFYKTFDEYNVQTRKADGHD
jgi:hydroxymethylglutaryl-CoA lyase